MINIQPIAQDGPPRTNQSAQSYAGTAYLCPQQEAKVRDDYPAMCRWRPRTSHRRTRWFCQRRPTGDQYQPSERAISKPNAAI